MRKIVYFFCAAFFLCANSQNLLNDFRRFFGASDITDTTNFRKSYDFVIVGAGSGGCVVANRLSENPNWSVLLLEAGDDENFLTDVPLIASLQTITSYNWGYKSERLKTACLGLIDGRCNMPRGKALGGTSVINFLLYTRGTKLDFDQWENLGNRGWNYDQVLPYFIKSENCTKCREIDGKYHGKSGYLSVEHPGYESPLVKLFIKSGEDLGYQNNDPNAPYGLGFSKVLATMRNGMRCSASKAFLKPVLHRPNLHISIKTRVTKILIDPNTKQAYGVEFLKNRRKFTVLVKKEVILSAGSINSPHLLMLSGVGPQKDLTRVGIPVLQNLKVGYNLQDHMAMSALVFFVNESITVSDRGVQNPVDIFNYVFNGRGPYTIPGGAEALAFVQTKYAKVGDYPDIELVLGAGALNGDVYGSLRSLLGIPRSLFERVYAPHAYKPAFSIAPVLMRPKSRGRVVIKDGNPLHWPKLIPNYFEDEEDVQTMVEGIKMAITITQSRYFQKYNITMITTPFPGCENVPFGTDAYWACAVRHVATTLGHQVGTCKMGPFSDPDAVVDEQLKVYGIKGLRVVDGSIMPNVVAGHTNAVIMMIGEKASDMIKQEWTRN
ncbi:glucose dehydrogenase [FAD, quinone] [Tribolium madens]|uniref:glucose dehydrogenase [FAD, quinone] n=1 Tax=Tribolium madens TaxID=41895 RepID=UPI001CF72E34|nr:glucose dehydrogenase [FAD, quinone] [Tribolium madens]